MNRDAPAAPGLGPMELDPLPATIARSRWRSESGLVHALWSRDLLRLVRERSRWLGVVLQPLLFWLLIGSGMGASFQIEGSNVGYLTFFFPGIMVMIILFTTIFASMAIIEDRQQGFLQQVLVAPGSRLALVLGKVAGVTSVALVQVVLCMLVAPSAGFNLGEIMWVQLLAATILGCVGLAGLSFAMAWIINSTHGYHALMAVVLLPLWMVSGAMFPAQGGWLDTVMAVNPMTYLVDALRFALHGGNPPASFSEAGTAFAVLAIFGVVMIALSTWLVDRVRREGT